MSDGITAEDTVYAVVCHEHGQWRVVVELSPDEWEAACSALGDVYRVVQSFDRYLTFAWRDLGEARSALVSSGYRDGSVPEALLLEYRILGFSTALWMYEEHVLAEVNRRKDEAAAATVKGLFSEVYDNERAYRVIYSLRNAFQHGVRGLVGFSGQVQPIGAGPEVTVTLHVQINKEKFAASHANGAVRREVAQMTGDPDVLAMCDAAYGTVQGLHQRLTPILSPEVANSTALIARYVEAANNTRFHLHAHPRGNPERPKILPMDRDVFEYVARQVGARVVAGSAPVADTDL